MKYVLTRHKLPNISECNTTPQKFVSRICHYSSLKWRESGPVLVNAVRVKGRSCSITFDKLVINFEM